MAKTVTSVVFLEVSGRSLVPKEGRGRFWGLNAFSTLCWHSSDCPNLLLPARVLEWLKLSLECILEVSGRSLVPIEGRRGFWD